MVNKWYTDQSVITEIVFSIIVSAVASLSLHIYLLKMISPIIANSMNGVVIQKPPYGLMTTTIAYATFIFPTIGSVTLYYFLQDFLPGKIRIIKGVWFALLLLLAKGELIRQPLMNFMIGNPVKVVLIQQSQVWLSNLVMGILIALLTPTILKKICSFGNES